MYIKGKNNENYSILVNSFHWGGNPLEYHQSTVKKELTISFTTLATGKSHKKTVTRIFISALHVLRKPSTYF